MEIECILVESNQKVVKKHKFDSPTVVHSKRLGPPLHMLFTAEAQTNSLNLERIEKVETCNDS